MPLDTTFNCEVKNGVATWDKTCTDLVATTDQPATAAEWRWRSDLLRAIGKLIDALADVVQLIDKAMVTAE